MWSYVRKVIPDGCGMRLTAELGRWLMCLAGVMFFNSKGYLNPLVSKSSVLMDGVPTKDIYQQQMHEVGKRKTQS